MKKILKFLPLLLVAVLGISMASCSDKDEPISVNELPSIAKDFIDVYFPSATVVTTEKDKDSYDVVLSDGTQIEFNKKGEWTDVDAAPMKALPTGFYPENIDTYIAANFEGLGINEISKVKRGFEVELTTGTEMLFGPDGEFIMIGVDR